MNVDKYLQNVAKKIRTYNKRLADAERTYGTDALYLDKSSTIVGTPNKALKAAIISRTQDEMKVSLQGQRITLTVEFDGYEFYVGGAEEFEAAIRYDKKCIRAGIKFYKSADPDSELEQEDE